MYGSEAELEHLMPILWGDSPEAFEGAGGPQGGPQGAAAAATAAAALGAPEGAPEGPYEGPSSFLQLNPPQLGAPPCSGSRCCSVCLPPKPCTSSQCIYLATQQQQQQQQQKQQQEQEQQKQLQQRQQQLAAERDLDRFLLQWVAY